MRKIPIAIIIVFLVGLALFSVNQFQMRQAYQRQLEANYQRAFRELATHLNGLEEELTKIQLVNSLELQAQIWANILRLVYSAQANLGQLPLSGLNLSRIEHLLANVQDQIVDLTHRNMRNISQAAEPDLVELYQQVQYLNNELQSQLALNGQNVSWVSWKKYIQTSMLRSSNIEPGERYPLMHSLVMVENGMQRFSPTEFPSETDPMQNQLPRGDLISEQEAVVIARQFLQELAAGRDLKVVNEAAGSLPTFTVQAMNETADYPITVEIAKYGGDLLWMTNGRIVSQSVLGKETLIGLAEEFLAQRNFPQMKLINSESRQNRLFLDFVPIENQILIYPQLLKLQLAEDNGQVLGFQGQAYYGLQSSREFTPKLTLAEAREQVKRAEDIIAENLAIILNPVFEEVLAYEFRVEHGRDEYLVYINADHGYEEKIRRVTTR